MTETVVSLHEYRTQTDIPTMLRNLALDIEEGNMPHLVTTCAVIIGHTTDTQTTDGVEHRHWTSLFVSGPRADAFTVSGMLHTVAGNL